jgi:hypothetical protein
MLVNFNRALRQVHLIPLFIKLVKYFSRENTKILLKSYLFKRKKNEKKTKNLTYKKNQITLSVIQHSYILVN